MRHLAVIAAATLLYLERPALFAWNATGAATLLIFTTVIGLATFWPHR